MQRKTITYRTKLPISASALFSWHMRPGAFDRLTPPSVRVEVLKKTGSPSDIGSEIHLKIHLGPFAKTCVFRHEEYVEDELFTDIQIRGPFKEWRHTHRFVSLGEAECEMVDEITFASPFFVSWAEKKIKKMLRWRHARLKNDLAALQSFPMTPKKILLSGAGGLVGSELFSFLTVSGHEMVQLKRGRVTEKGTIGWNPDTMEANPADFEGFDAVIHLAGKNIASGRWTDKLKKEIYSSRVDDTLFLSEIIENLHTPPSVALTASAVGFYGDRGEEVLTEESSKGEGFLSDVCRDWEEASFSMEKAGVRRVFARFGLILSPKGGVLAKLLPVFRLGFGAVLGKGKQKLSWMAIDDVVYALYHCLHTPQLQGPVNFVAPVGETNASFSKKLAKSLHRESFLKLGEKLLKILGGEMAQELFLSSANATPKKLIESGYIYTYPDLDSFFMQHFS